MRWTADDNAKRDFLHLINGKKVPFTESYELCGQCHGDKYRDWKVGVHGKRIGMWNGKKTYYLCLNRHNPHNPGSRAQPEPPPIPAAGAGPMSHRNRLPVIQDAPWGGRGSRPRPAATSSATPRPARSSQRWPVVEPRRWSRSCSAAT